MPNGGNILAAAQAVTVLGVGGAGCRMLDAVAERVSDLGGGPSYEFVAIDSREAELDAYAPAEARQVHLETPVTTFAADTESRQYLDSSSNELSPVGGTARDRSIGRYYLDSIQNFDGTARQLRETIEEHAKETDHAGQGVHQVWVLHALGGGTGSGLAPLLFALLDTFVPDETPVFGVGLLPRLDRLEETPRMPERHRFSLNAHAALRELRVLFGLEGKYPHTLGLGGNSSTFTTDELTVKSPPVTGYGLFGVAEGRVGDGETLETVNRAVAEFVCGAATDRRLLESAIGWDSYTPLGHRPETTLFTFDWGGVQAPVEQLQRYAELGDEHEAVEKEREALGADIDSLRAARDHLSALLDREAGEDEPLADVVETALASWIRSLDPVALDEPAVDDAIDAVGAELAVPSALDPELVATYLVSQDAREHLTDAHHEHSFPAEVERVADRYERRLDGPVAAADSDPHEVWGETLEPLLRQHLRMLESKREETSFLRRLKLSELESELDDARGQYERLQTLADSFDRIRRRRGAVTERYETARSALASARHDVEEQLESTRESLESACERARQIEATRDRLETRLTDAEPGGPQQLPVTADALDAPAATLDSMDSLGDWLDRGFLAPAALADGLDRTLDGLHDRVQDRELRLVDSPSESHLSLGVAVGDVEFLRDLPVSGYSFDHAVDRFDDFSSRDGTDPVALSALATFSPVHLENTSEFGTIHEHYTDQERQVGDLFGVDDAEDIVAECLAYPELVEESDSVRPSDH